MNSIIKDAPHGDLWLAFAWASTPGVGRQKDDARTEDVDDRA
jgi:hypothetical protein